MRGAVALTTALLAVGCSALHLNQRDGPPAVIEMEIVRKPISNLVKRDQLRLRRRQSKSVAETLDNFEVWTTSTFSDDHP